MSRTVKALKTPRKAGRKNRKRKINRAWKQAKHTDPFVPKEAPTVDMCTSSMHNHTFDVFKAKCEQRFGTKLTSLELCRLWSEELMLEIKRELLTNFKRRREKKLSRRESQNSETQNAECSVSG